MTNMIKLLTTTFGYVITLQVIACYCLFNSPKSEKGPFPYYLSVFVLSLFFSTSIFFFLFFESGSLMFVFCVDIILYLYMVAAVKEFPEHYGKPVTKFLKRHLPSYVFETFCGNCFNVLDGDREKAFKTGRGNVHLWLFAMMIFFIVIAFSF